MPRHFPPPGSPPAILQPRSDRPEEPAEIRLMQFGPEHFHEAGVASVEELPCPQDTGHGLWVEVNGLGDIAALQALGEKYNLHPLALEDALNTGQRAKYECYDEHAFIVVHMVYFNRDLELCTEQVSIFLGEDYLITVQEEAEFDVFEPVRARLRSGRTAIRQKGPDYLAYALIDSITDHIFPILEDLGGQLEEMEERLLENPEGQYTAKIHDLRRTFMRLRRIVWPARDVINSMVHEESKLISPSTKIFLRDCYDHAIQIIDLLENYRETAAGLMEIYHSALSLRTNEVMRVLTVISAIFIPLTFIAGVYGMNFDYADGKMPLNMPELHSPHGYVVCVVVMLAVAVGLIVFFKRKRWW